MKPIDGKHLTLEPSTRLFAPNPLIKVKEFAPYLQLENCQPIGELDFSVMQSGFFEVRENDHNNSYYIAIQVAKDKHVCISFQCTQVTC